MSDRREKINDEYDIIYEGKFYEIVRRKDKDIYEYPEGHVYE